MGWRTAVRLADVAFDELAFQAVFAFRQGNVLPAESAQTLVPKARRRVTQSKALVSVVLGLLAIGAAALLHRVPTTITGFFAAPLPVSILDAGVITGLLALDVAFLWWTGLQVLPTLLASAVVPVLEPLPIDGATLRRTIALVYLRLFDAPIATVLIVTPIAMGISLGAAAGVAVVPGVVSAVVFSLALSLVTGRFFVRRIQGARGGGGRAWVRWGYLLLWLVPSFAILGFLTAATQFFNALSVIAAGGPTVVRELLYNAYPVPFGLLTGVAAHGPGSVGLRPGEWVALIAAVEGYVALTVWSAAWLFREVRELGHIPPRPPMEGPVAEFRLRPQISPWAVLTKDLRIASRTPGYAFLLLLPVLDAVALGLITVADAPGPSAAIGLALGAVTAAALLATFFGPAFFAIEVLAFSYGRTLPLSDRAIIVGKVGLMALVYLAASGIVLLMALVRVFDPLLFVGFILAELPAIAAAGALELGWLFRTARRRGFPVVNLYSGAWTAIVVAIPGLVIAGAPLLLFRYAGIGGMAALSLVELAACAPVALARRSS